MTNNSTLNDPDPVSPYEQYRRLLNEPDVHWDSRTECWLLVHFDDVASALTNDALVAGFEPGYVRSIIPGHPREADYVGEHFRQWPLFLDPPAHTSVRRAIRQAYYDPAVMDRVALRLRDEATKLLECVTADGAIDVVRDFARPIGRLTFEEFVGVDDKLAAKAQEWADELLRLLNTPPSASSLLSAERVIRDIDAATAVLCESDDLATPSLASELCRSVSQGEFTISQAAAVFSQNATAVLGILPQFIAGAIATSLRFPHFIESLFESEHAAQLVVGELLRHVSPVLQVGRVAARDFDLRGAAIRQGDTVRLLVGVANHDARRFPCPGILALGDRATKHLAFGQGSHHCLGAGITGLVGRLSLQAFFMQVDARTDYSQTERQAAFSGMRWLDSLELRRTPA
jgi:cytochrome P450